MATLSAVPALITIEEYLASSYEPDMEFVDGVLEERTSVGDAHGLVLAALGHWFFLHRAEWQVDVLTGYSLRTLRNRVRVTDICVVRQGDPVEKVRVSAPLLCIEILSPEDRPGRVMKRLDEFVAMGVENIWILDPSDRSASTYARFGMKGVEGDRLEIAETAIYLEVKAIFATLDEARYADRQIYS